MSVERGVAELNRAHDLARGGAFEEALAVADHAAEHLGADPEGRASALELAAELAARLGRIDASLDRLVALDSAVSGDVRRQWLARQAAASIARRLADGRAVELAREAAAAARRVSSEATAHALGDLAGALVDAGRMEEADSLLRDALVATQDDIAAEILVVHRVELALAIGRGEVALAMTESAGTGTARLTRVRAQTLVACSRPAEAVAVLGTLDPGTLEPELAIEVLVTMAGALRALDRADDERACHESIVRLGEAELPEVALDSWSRLAVLRDGKQAIEASLSAASLAARIGERETAGMIFLRAGQDAARLGEIRLAKRAFERAAGILAGPGRISALVLLGQVLRAVGEPDAALKAFDDALVLVEDDASRAQITQIMEG